jgi:deazaflavin-dependent oxidoreductase (nitroreductase family)
MRIDAYLFFPGCAAEAMEFDKGVFGGTLTVVRRGEVDPSATDAEKDLVIDATLDTGELYVRASDRDDATKKPQARFALTLIGTDEARLRIRRSFLFTGGLPLLVVTTVGRRTGQRRSTPLGYTRSGDAFAVIASNAGSDRVPAWWLNLQADPHADILVNRTQHHVIARPATPTEDNDVWEELARLNPGYDEYRNLTDRRIPVVLLEPAPSARRYSYR